MKPYNHNFVLKDGRRAVAHIYGERDMPGMPGLESLYFDLTINESPEKGHIPVEASGGWNDTTIENQIRKEYDKPPLVEA